MRLIDTNYSLDHDEIVLVDKEIIDDKPYAILSHTWGRQVEVGGKTKWGGEDDEILFADVGKTDTSKKKSDAWRKIQRACQAAQKQECDYLWVDTCCIDKEDKGELDESINAMFAWYQQSKVCFVYLADLEVDSVIEQGEEELKKCRWFRRGWTLQELIAPVKVEFYNQDWQRLGSRDELVDILHEITGINRNALSGKVSCFSFPVAEKMKWAFGRQTKRPEDRAYSLFGLFGVHMTLAYGVGQEAAFRRLQIEIIQNTTDMTVFAWSPNNNTKETSQFCSMLADSPDRFADTPTMSSMELEGHLSITNKGVFLDASTLRVVPRKRNVHQQESKQASQPALVLLIGYNNYPDHMICYGVYLQKIGSANYARYRTHGLAEFKEDKRVYKLKPVPRHQCYITISPRDVESALRKSHRKAIVVPEEFKPKRYTTVWGIKVLDRVPERIWDYQEGLFFRVGYGHRDVVRAVSVELHLLDQKVKFTVLLHRYGDSDKVFILDEKNTKLSGVKPIFGPSQRFDSVKWDDLAIDLAVQSEYLDVVAQGRSYRVSATLGTNEDGKMELKLDVASDAYQQIEDLKDQQIESLERRLKDLEELVKEIRTRLRDDEESEDVNASMKRPRTV